MFDNTYDAVGLPVPCTEQAVPRWKRWGDFAIALPLLLLSGPIMLLAIAVVRLTSRGPGIYTQTRLGLNRKPFTIYKIRTMGHNCEAKTGARWSTPKDARVTPVGRFLRKTHIDELPQLWNVLRGDMSLVGPRPERPEIVATIEPLVHGYGSRLTVLPGVTGLAQLRLPPDTTVESVRRKVCYDAYYAATLTPWLDLRLIAATGFKMLGLLRFVRAPLGIPGARQVEIARVVQFVEPVEVAITRHVDSEPDLTPA